MDSYKCQLSELINYSEQRFFECLCEIFKAYIEQSTTSADTINNKLRCFWVVILLAKRGSMTYLGKVKNKEVSALSLDHKGVYGAIC
jgi:hypothetical protein